MKISALIFGILGSILALGIGLGSIGILPAITDGYTQGSFGVIRGISGVFLPIMGLMGAGLVITRPRIGAAFMAFSALALILVTGFNQFILIPAALLGMSALLSYLSPREPTQAMLSAAAYAKAALSEDGAVSKGADIGSVLARTWAQGVSILAIAIIALSSLAVAMYLGSVNETLKRDLNTKNASEQEAQQTIGRLFGQLQATESQLCTAQTMQNPIPKGLAPESIIGSWRDDGVNCIKIARGDNHTYLVKAWYCAMGEPKSAVTLSAQCGDITNLHDQSGRTAIRMLSSDTLIATFEYPPPTNGPLNMHVLFKKTMVDAKR